MTWFEAVVRLIGYLVWPIAVVIVVFRLKTDLSSLLSRVSEFTAPGGISAKLLREEVENAGRLARAASPESEEQDEAKGPSSTETADVKGKLEVVIGPSRIAYDISPDPISRLIPRALDEPLASVVLAWQEVEEEANRAAMVMDVRPWRVIDIVRALINRQVLDMEMEQVAQRLKDVRNRVVHDKATARALTGEVAQEFVETSRRLLFSIRSAVVQLSESDGG